MQTIDYFGFKQIKGAIVSEISEAVAASPVPPEERVNFHIGNPVQDERLALAYLKIILNLSTEKVFDFGYGLNEIKSDLDLTERETKVVEFYLRLIKKSAPYLPRGGFLKANPGYLLKQIDSWFRKGQFESLSYDLGETSGRREIILSAGGILETIRMFLHAVEDYLIFKPASVLLYGLNLPGEYKVFRDLSFINCGGNEEDLLKLVNDHFTVKQAAPLFIILGEQLTDNTRRKLRIEARQNPVYFVEANDSPNHLSLAREAKLDQRVVRFLTPSILNPQLKNSSITIVAGPEDIIKVIETIHFKLKGTPSASEVELISYIHENRVDATPSGDAPFEIEFNGEGGSYFGVPESLSRRGERIERLGNRVINNSSKTLEHLEKEHLKEALHTIEEKLNSIQYVYNDSLAGYSAFEILNRISSECDLAEWKDRLEMGFLHSFIKHNRQYDAANCFVVSGSSRTALALIGYNCGIDEVIVPDLSWTYEHCFPRVAAVPLCSDYSIDEQKIISLVREKYLNKKERSSFAVAINNPHNATGKEFEKSKIETLIAFLLSKGVYVIDDLSYQNVAPGRDLREIKTIKQIAVELKGRGFVSSDSLKYVITVHSVSKTDSMAGARLSVVEIPDPVLNEKFRRINRNIKTNTGAVLLSYLFYRNSPTLLNSYWKLRNTIFYDRMKALTDALENMPSERNSSGINIIPPTGSMYPLLVVENLPSGVSLDWLASGLSKQGIGILPLSTFARTEAGYEIGRKTFRLTLGGSDNVAVLYQKTRKMIIDLNRLIGEEACNYVKWDIPRTDAKKSYSPKAIPEIDAAWQRVEEAILSFSAGLDKTGIIKELVFDKTLVSEYTVFLRERLAKFKTRLLERGYLSKELTGYYSQNNGLKLVQSLEKEFYKDSAAQRRELFKNRLYDRTVHPTQMYSIRTERAANKIADVILRNGIPGDKLIKEFNDELVNEFFGGNVAVSSAEEAEELVLDLENIIGAENYFEISSSPRFDSFISFWSDWDGSSRPSGQGHRLAAEVLIHNIEKQASLIKSLLQNDKSIPADGELIAEIGKLPETNLRFIRLLNEITSLTNTLEKKYKGTLPYKPDTGALRNLAVKLRIAEDPLTSLWKHNNRYEVRMLELRNKRRVMLEYYFSLNKKLRKYLYELIPAIRRNLSNPAILFEASHYKDLLKRFIITPRIHQNMIVSQDQFSLDTTIHNINELNYLSAKYGNPGIILGLQISMSTKPEALISLERKMKTARETGIKDTGTEIPSVSFIPLFEDQKSVSNVTGYLNKIWEYSFQSRKIAETTEERFSGIISEIFIAGSDLSQQVSQSAAMALYREAKYNTVLWLAEKGLLDSVRMKLGCGEPMQRQGGYYSTVSGNNAFRAEEIDRFLSEDTIPESARRSMHYAKTPLTGIWAGGDLKTYQSNVSEKLRFIPVENLARLLYHVKQLQNFHRFELLRASEPLIETRLDYKTRGVKEIERLTIGKKDPVYETFLTLLTDSFRNIIYGSEEDVLGIHLVSYFTAKTILPLRDRPTSRPSERGSGNAGKKIIENIADTIPFAKHGTLLRAISHNQAQTALIGLNQLTTGLFRALEIFSQKHFKEGNSSTLITERIMPRLPVYEILRSLHTYHDNANSSLNAFEPAFNAGNSSFTALREDTDAMYKYIPFMQRELLRIHGVNPSHFFESGALKANLLPLLRPDLAVLLQSDIFNDDIELLLKDIKQKPDRNWIEETGNILEIRKKIKYYRKKVWNLIEKPVYQRTASFVNLAMALYRLSNMPIKDLPGNYKPKFKSGLSNFIKNDSDDNLQQFLFAAVEYISAANMGIIEVPADIIKALHEVESIVKIDEAPLSAKELKQLRFYSLQIARLAGENG